MCVSTAFACKSRCIRDAVPRAGPCQYCSIFKSLGRNNQAGRRGAKIPGMMSAEVRSFWCRAGAMNTNLQADKGACTESASERSLSRQKHASNLIEIHQNFRHCAGSV